jgi:SPP1 gp7 family putative phage head morphogenesis protein
MAKTLVARLQRITRDYRARLLSREADAADALKASYGHIWAGIQPSIDRLSQQMRNAAYSGDPVNAAWLYREQRLQHLQQAFSDGTYHFAQLAQAQTQAVRTWAAYQGQQSAQDLLYGSMPVRVSYTFGVPSPQAMQELTGRLHNGSPVAKLFAGWGEKAAGDAKQTLLSGVALGKHPRQVARDLAQAGQQPLQRALVIARDQMVDTYRSAALETYRANSDVVGQWMWMCDQSANTCAACLAMDGTLHDLDEEMDAHTCCRCAAVPVTNSWADILGPLGIDTSDIPETNIAAGYQTGADWLDQQDAATQDQVLGKAGGAAYRAGDVSLSDFVGHKDDATWGGAYYQRSYSDMGIDPSDY